MKKEGFLLMAVAPIALSLLGVLANVLCFLSFQTSFINFIFTIVFCVLWLILFYYLPSFKSRALHMFYLAWWFVGLFCAIANVFSYYITGGREFSFELIPITIFVSPMAGVQLLFTSYDPAKFTMAIICFVFFATALSEAFIFHNMTSRQLDFEEDQESDNE